MKTAVPTKGIREIQSRPLKISLKFLDECMQFDFEASTLMNVKTFEPVNLCLCNLLVSSSNFTIYNGCL